MYKNDLRTLLLNRKVLSNRNLLSLYDIWKLKSKFFEGVFNRIPLVNILSITIHSSPYGNVDLINYSLLSHIYGCHNNECVMRYR